MSQVSGVEKNLFVSKKFGTYGMSWTKHKN